MAYLAEYQNNALHTIDKTIICLHIWWIRVDFHLLGWITLDNGGIGQSSNIALGKNMVSHDFHYPIGSMYGIYANIGVILMLNVTIYSIHGSYGIHICPFPAAYGRFPVDSHVGCLKMGGWWSWLSRWKTLPFLMNIPQFQTRISKKKYILWKSSHLLLKLYILSYRLCCLNPIKSPVLLFKSHGKSPFILRKNLTNITSFAGEIP